MSGDTEMKKGNCPDNEQIIRITGYENMFDEIAEASENLKSAVNAFETALTKAEELEAYYLSDEWKKDFASDEAGLLPADLKRGVLSEDGVYNLLENVREIAKRILFDPE